MKNAVFFHKTCFIYPKSYGVFINGEVLVQALNNKKKRRRISPTVLFTEDDNYCHIYINIPGGAGKNYLIYLDLNVVSVYMLPGISDNTKQQNQVVNELGYRCFTHKIVLPENLSIGEVTAVYRLNTLCIQLSKVATTSKGKHHLFFVES